jgi:Xaa-Pro aminopeptidase
MAMADSDHLADRHTRVRAFLREHELDGLIVTHLPNIFYLSNFTGTAAILVLTARELVFITDFRYFSSVEASLSTPHGCPSARLVRVQGSYEETLAAIIDGLDASRIGFEAAHLSVARYEWLCVTLGTTRGNEKLTPTDRFVERLRLVKDAAEIATIRQAAGMLSEVAVEMLREVRAGQSERDVATTIDWKMKRAGFDRPAFETIVASGPNAALPHARPGSRVLSPGDLVVLDFGGAHDGYCVDLTRTISIGDPDGEARRVHAAVADAAVAAIGAVRPGIRASAIDAAARDSLARRALADAFGHGTGHGLGIEVHEEPRIGPARASSGPSSLDETIAPGMVFTIEPGAYVPGWGGVRIEDDVLVTEDGREVLTSVSRELVVV